MLTCSKCGCFCDNADLIGGICDDCREAERKEEQRKQETERLMRAEYKQLELEDFNMRDMNMEEFKNATEGKSIEDFVQKVKEMPIYAVYEKAVKDKEEDDTAKLLQMSVMLFSMADKELSMMMTSISMELLFAMVDQRLRNEILGESEE